MTRIRKQKRSKASSDKIRGDALELLRSPDLLSRIVKDTQDAFDIHGEIELIQILYLAISSRRLSDPISVIVQGEPGSGKTFVIDGVCQFVPPSELWAASHVSPRALYYDQEGVSHKVLNCKERSRNTGPEAQEHTSAIRQLISDKRITNRTVSAERSGEVQTVEGPICYLESTTLEESKIFDEDLSRCLLLKTTAGPEHRRGVLHAIAKRDQNGHDGRESRRDEIIAKHRLIQDDLLSTRPVIIPFHSQLADSFPVSTSATTRLFERLSFSLRASAYLHQHQRERGINGEIVAAADDYRIVKPIVDRCLADALSRTLKGAAAKVFAGVREAGQITRAALYAKLGTGRKTVSGNSRTQFHKAVESLLSQGALIEPVKGRGSKAGVLRCYELPSLTLTQSGAV